MPDTAIARPGAANEPHGDSRKYGHPKDPRLVPEMAEKVAEARKRWEDRLQGISSKPLKDGSDLKRTGSIPRVQLSFDEMLDALLEDCVSYTDIGIACGVSRESIRQIHQKYFSSILPYRSGTGHKRVKTCTLVKRKQNIESLTLSDSASRFAEAAKRHGIEVAPVLWSFETHGSTVGCRRREVKVSNKLIKIRERRTARAMNQRGNHPVRYFRFFVSSECDFYALFAGDPLSSWFIFPAELIRRDTIFYIPERPNTYWMNAHVGTTDWLWQYREAWHLLKEGTD